VVDPIQVFYDRLAADDDPLRMTTSRASRAIVAKLRTHGLFLASMRFTTTRSSDDRKPGQPACSDKKLAAASCSRSGSG
jgi:hypothetical protein